jgi:hypothetical protein
MLVFVATLSLYNINQSFRIFPYIIWNFCDVWEWLHFDLENIEAAWATSGRVIALVSMRPALNCSVGKNKKKQLSGLDFFFFFFLG